MADVELSCRYIIYKRLEVLLPAVFQHEVVAADMISWQTATERQKCNKKTWFMSGLPVRSLKSQNKTVNVRSAARGGSRRHDLCVSRL